MKAIASSQQRLFVPGLSKYSNIFTAPKKINNNQNVYILKY